ncbi:uncharacterized protein METZ01_LOCUS441833 [marine metagenome]|uniref:Uncharacterized protein n=1 Tax=marine metagenome TaxID=408172 RepID=A0A382Z1A2_9ZZZZ
MKFVRVLYHDDPKPKVFSGRQDWKFCFDWMLDANAEREYTDHEILDIVWEQWNAGSGHESKFFLNLGVRSMMVGDYVHISGDTEGSESCWHECLPFGWRIDVPWEEVMGDKPKDKKGHELTEGEIVKALIEKLDLDSDIQVRVE